MDGSLQFRIFSVITMEEGRDLLKSYLEAHGRPDLASRVVIWTEHTGGSFKPGRRMIKITGSKVKGRDKVAMDDAVEFMLEHARLKEAGLK